MPRRGCERGELNYYGQDIIKPAIKFSGGSKIIWKCIMSEGVSLLEKIEGKMIAVDYVKSKHNFDQMYIKCIFCFVFCLSKTKCFI